jgi:hypothetical protein
MLPYFIIGHNMSNGKITDEQLLKMAMGIEPDEPDAKLANEIMKLRAEWEVVPSRGLDRLTRRRKMRYHMFKIIKCLTREAELTPQQEAIRSIIEPQLEKAKQQNWYSFTFNWDLHPKDHTKIITKDRWFAEGGSYDELGALKPSAFTEQQID